MDWVYKQIIGFLANFFAEMGNMGAEMFEMSWVQSIVLFFSYLAWILYAVGFVVACAECGLEYSSGRADIKGTAMNLIKGFMAVSLFSVVPVKLYELCVSLQANFGYAISGAGFAFMVGGSVQDFLVSFVIALLMGCTLVSLERKKIPFFVAPLMGGLVTGLAACMAHALLPATQLDKLIIGTMKVLLPGLALSKAMRDLLEGNLISGNSKVVEVLLIACSIAAGVAVALTLFQMTE